MSIKDLTVQILSKMSDIGKWKSTFMIHIFWLYVSLRGKYNFANMSRYGSMNEASYRQNFAKAFDFLSFNSELVKAYGSQQQVIVFDPSYVGKSGKHTYGVGYFWSGVASQHKPGLEIGGFAAVDLQHWTGMHLLACQTPTDQQISLMQHYINLLKTHANSLQQISTKLCVDAYFSKKNYVDAALQAGFQIVSRLRSDVVLRYLYQGAKTRKRGRPKVYAGKVDLQNLDEKHFRLCIHDTNLKAYEAVVNAKALQRNIRVVVVHQFEADGSLKATQVFFSTDTAMLGIDILLTYKGRFQIEFLYRDAKQHTGLQEAQCRAKEKLHFHFNASLTAVSLAKAMHYFKDKAQEDTTQQPLPHRLEAFSMADIKTQYFNELLLSQFFSVFGIDPKQIKKSEELYQLYNLGKIAA